MYKQKLDNIFELANEEYSDEIIRYSKKTPLELSSIIFTSNQVAFEFVNRIKVQYITSFEINREDSTVYITRS